DRLHEPHGPFHLGWRTHVASGVSSSFSSFSLLLGLALWFLLLADESKRNHKSFPTVSKSWKTQVYTIVNTREAKSSTGLARGRNRRGRIRNLRAKPAGTWAESHLTEPTGFESSVTNFFPLPCPVGHTVSKAAKAATPAC